VSLPDEGAFCQQFRPRVLHYALRHLRDPQLAADLAQEVLVIALEAMRAGRIERPERLGSFVLSTCRHLVWDENRAESRRRRANLDAPAGEPDAPTLPLGDRMRLEQCMRNLAPRERTVVFLTYCEDWQADEIAAHLGTTPGNVRVIRHRALAELARSMEAAP
jgi:RNA polymerase sigma-70 factor (ECF subfamily)